jgi:hypothetical protein
MCNHRVRLARPRLPVREQRDKPPIEERRDEQCDGVEDIVCTLSLREDAPHPDWTPPQRHSQIRTSSAPCEALQRRGPVRCLS